MEKSVIFSLLVVLMVGFVFAADEWGEINTEEGVVDNASGSEEEFEAYSDDDYVPASEYVPQTFDDGKFYTNDFYIALGVGVFVLVVIGFVVWLLIRGPRNKWDK